MDAAAFGISGGLPTQSNAVKFYYSKRKESLSKELKRSAASRQPLCAAPQPHSASSYEELEIGAFYEIDHEKLPPKSPIHLKAVRVVKISEKTKVDVTVIFPSTYSLRNYFSSIAAKGASERIPELDEMFVMSTNHAGRILRKFVPASQLNKEKNHQRFWLVAPFVLPTVALTPADPNTETTAEEEEEEEKEDEEEDHEQEEKTTLQSLCKLQLDLRRSGSFGWGVRRKVRYFRQQLQRESQPQSQSLPRLGKMKEMDEDDRMEVVQNVICTRKRARDVSKLTNKKKEKNVKSADRNELMRKKRKKKKLRHEQREEKVKHEERDVGRGRSSGSKDRWSAERYESAELKLLDIMREKGAVLGNPILRQELRDEARKHIGDTGLLDHLLKHMAGKCVKDRTERFRRRHNAEGAMEYWLEPAELDEVRRKAGVLDPYWLPPPGWKPGDSTSSCACGTECQKEVDQLAEDVGELKRNVEELLSLKQLEKDEEQSDAAAITVLQEKYDKLIETNLKLEEMVSMCMSTLKEVKQEMVLLKQEQEGAALIKKGEEEKTNEVAAQIVEMGEKEENINGEQAGKNKGVLIRKSGFRICKPQGTFLWPNMGTIGNSNNNSNVVCDNTTTNSTVTTTTTVIASSGAAAVAPANKSMAQLQYEYQQQQQQLLMFYGGVGIPTPPSCSSATSAPKLLLLPSPATPKSSTSSSPAAGAAAIFGQRQQQQMKMPRATSAGRDEGMMKRMDGQDAAELRGAWSSIATDLVLATPSPSPNWPLNSN